MSTRLGGVSKPPFSSLNVALHVGDRDTDVITNRTDLIKTANVPSGPAWLNQTHGTEIIELGDCQIDRLLNYDGSITKQRGVVCAIMTADCLPLFICNRSGDQVGLLHVGWRGLAQGIVEQGIQMFDGPPGDLIVWAGPCISLEYFEIGNEVRKQLGGPEDAYRESSRKGKVFADLYRLTADRLATLGVSDYSYSQYCTYRDKENFFSHRRDKQTGRMASLIWFD